MSSRLLSHHHPGILTVAALMAILFTGSCTDAGRYPALRDSRDTGLQERLMRSMRVVLPVPELGKTMDAERMSVVVADITQLKRPRVAAINGDTMLYAASLPKLAILAAAFVDVDKGRLQLDEGLLEQLTLMIRESSNPATNRVLDRVGIERVNEIMQGGEYRLYDPEFGGGLWVGRDFGGGKSWKRDPINGISHGASAMQVARLYYLLLTGRLVSEESTHRMLEILSEPAIHHKFVKGLSEENPDARIFRKSGTWKYFHADSGIVIDEEYQYIAVFIIEHESGGKILEDGIGVIDQAIEESNP